MAIKCISGVIQPKRPYQSKGTFTINLLSGETTETEVAKFSELAMFGGDSRFATKPCLNISLRHVHFKEEGGGPFPIGASGSSWIDLTDNLINLNGAGINSGLQVSWSCSPLSSGDNRFSEVLEISVLAIGETS